MKEKHAAENARDLPQEQRDGGERHRAGEAERMVRQRCEPSDKATETERKSNQAEIERTNSRWREAERDAREGEAEFKAHGEYRRSFCHEAGSLEHKEWEKQMFDAEIKSGRVWSIDYEIEVKMDHPDGGKVRLDHADYQRDIITDRKPIGKNETEQHVMDKYREQRERHIEAYEFYTGRKVREYRYSLYASSRDTMDD